MSALYPAAFGAYTQGAMRIPEASAPLPSPSRATATALLRREGLVAAQKDVFERRPRHVPAGLFGDLSKQGIFVCEERGQRLVSAEVEARIARGEPFSLAVKGRTIDRPVPVTTLRDVQALDVLYRTGDTASLAHPALGAALRNLEAHGCRFFRNPTLQGSVLTKVGAYGAWHQLTEHENGQLLYVGGGACPTTMLSREVDVLAASFFLCEGTADGLPDPDVARAVRDLAKRGYTFHDASDGQRELTAQKAWSSLRSGSVRLGLCGVPLQPLTAEVAEHPERLEASTRQLAELYAATLAERVARHEVTVEDVGALAAAAAPERGDVSLADRWHALVALFDAERSQVQGLAASTRAARIFEGVEAGRSADESLPQALAAFGGLQARIPYPHSLETFDFIRHGGLDAHGRQRFEQVAVLLREFGPSRDAFSLVGADFEGRFPLLAELAAFEDGRVDARSAAARAAQDLGAVLAATDPREGVEVLCSLHRALDGREGWNAAQGAFQFLADGVAQGSLGHRTLKETADSLVSHYLLRGDLERARAEVAMGARDPGTVEQTGDGVVIGGVRVPRRPG
jgi:hypothetical protein